ncbi:hypothetical protein D3C87_453740 [compost metagenome]|uniref:DUF4142 domain-containing protein n=1 Tax=Achromobacter sp. Root83 TaxID=1736602 RepID=UPI00070C0462|nr:DUF4142 domain-containing protein [Achromobacter sp. Root83]KRC79244.1 hypothetical protein ASE30_25035 [Achromobacter sp. Root83]
MKKIRNPMLAVLAAMSMLLGAQAASYAADLAESDARFLQAAASAGMFEVKAAELAGKRAENTEVKAFAAKMLEQHRALNAELKTLAATKKVALPAEPDEPDRATLEALQGKTGAAFDQLYVDKAALDAHAMANRLFGTAAKESEDPQIREFAARALPMLADHYSMSRALKREPAANGEKIQPAVKGEAPAVSPASREAPASIVPAK